MRNKEDRNQKALDYYNKAYSLAQSVPARWRDDFAQQFLLAILEAPEDTYTFRRAKSKAFNWLNRELAREVSGSDGDNDYFVAKPCRLQGRVFDGLPEVKATQEQSLAFLRWKGRLLNEGCSAEESYRLVGETYDYAIEQAEEFAGSTTEECEEGLQEWLSAGDQAC